MALIDAVFTNRVVNVNANLQDDNIKAFLLVIGAAGIVTAGIGKKFFEMDNLTAGIVAGAGSALVVSAVTERDAPLYLLGIAALVGTGVATVQAFRDGRFYVKVELADLLRLAFDILKK